MIEWKKADVKEEEKMFNKRSTNICKGIAILMMYVHHSFYNADAWKNAEVIFTPFTESQILLLAKLCKVCVAVFVFLSAFGVCRSSEGKPEASVLDKTTYLPVVARRYQTLLCHFGVIYLLSQLCSQLIGRTRTAVYGENVVKRLIYTVIDAMGLAHALDTPTYCKTWWYMSFAFLLILLLPVLVVAAQKVGYALLPMSILLPLLAGFDMGSNVFRYLPAAVMGILCAQYHIFEKMYEMIYLRKTGCTGWKINVLLFLTGAGCLLVMFFLSYCRLRLGYVYLFENMLALVICAFCYLVLEQIPGLSRMLAFLGKHSMNMFLTHSLIRGNTVRLHDFSYMPRYPILIILLLVMDTVLLSVIIEWVKTVLQQIWEGILPSLRVHRRA